MDPGRRLYDGLARLYPRGFRARYGEELTAFFEAERARARRGGWVETGRFWLWTVVDLAGAGFRLRLRAIRSAGVSGGRSESSRGPGTAAGGPAPGGPSGFGPTAGERLAGFVSELGQAARSLRRQPTYSLAAVVTLALGIGASVSIFSVADAVLFRPLPYPDADALVAIGNVWRGRVGGMSAPNARDLAASAGTLGSVSMSRVGTLDLTGDGEPERLIGAAVTPGWFEQLGVSAGRGRLFGEADDRPTVDRVGVISHELWVRRWNGDPTVVGRTFMANGAPLTVVGVMPAGFRGPVGLGQSAVEVWYPLSFVDRGEDPLSNRADPFLTVLARLAPGATVEAATAEVESIGAVLGREYPAENGRGGSFELGVVSLRESTLGNARSRIALFGGAVLLLFIAALSNGAGLMLGRIAQRGRELAVRRALGAARVTIVRQVLSESAVLAALGCGLGIPLAVAGLAVFVRLQPGLLPRADGVGLNLRVLVFAVVATALVSLLVGLVPGLRAARLRSTDALRSAGRHGPGPGSRFRRLLVVVETGLALMLLAGAGLLMNSFVRLTRVPLGFETDGVVTMEVFVGGWQVTAADRMSVYRRLMSELDASSAVREASVTTDLPLGVSKLAPVRAATGGAGDAVPLDAGMHYVAPRYFAALSIPVLPGGRDFTDTDVERGSPVVIVNRALALELFDREDAVGERISVGGSRDLTVIGVVGDVRHQGLDIGRDFEVYGPHSGGFIGPPLNVIVRSGQALDVLVPVLRSAVRAADPDLPIGRIAPLEARVRSASATQRFQAFLVAMFAFAAVAIAVTGLYGTMAHAVAQRTREIGVRVALGADAGRILRLVLRGGMGLSLIGIAAGLAGTLAAGRALAGLLFGITPADLPTLAGVALLMAGVQLAACLLPARRAATLPVARTLRSEAD